ncbi:MAG: xanthine dehydrogenase family protein subunit M [Halopseudomonas sp.]
MTRYFEYLRPKTVSEAVELKALHGDSAKFWAGGTDMMLQWKGGVVSPDYCIDLSYLTELRYVQQDGNSLRIGALATLDDIDRNSGLGALSATLGATARLMCTQQSRTIATLGGNLCNGSPSADMYPTLVVMGAVVKILGPNGERTMPLDEFHTGVRKTALADDEILVEIVVPEIDAKSAGHYNRVARTVVDIALVSSAAFIKLGDNGVVERAGIALGGVAPTVLRVVEAENMLLGKTLASIDEALIADISQQAMSSAVAITDIRASKEYRTEMTSVLTKRAIRHCIEELGGTE